VSETLPLPAPEHRPEWADRAAELARQDLWSAEELLALRLPSLPATARRIRDAMNRDRVLAHEETVKGGQRLLFNRHAMPRAIRLEMAAAIARWLPEAPAGAAQDAPEADLQALAQLPGPAHARAVARLSAVRAYAAWSAAAGLSGRRAADRFAEVWEAGAAGVAPWVQTALKGFCGASLLAWQATLAAHGAAALAGRYRPREAEIDRTPALLARAEAAIAEWPHITGARLHDILAHRATELDLTPPAPRSVTRWLTAWKAANRGIHLALANPDAHRNRYRPSFGNAAADAPHVNACWEFDDTPADVLLTDGQRHAVIGVIDVHTRRLMLQVHPTSTAHGVSLLLRRALLAWGVPDRVRTDNGAAYVSRHVTGVLARLDVAHQVLPPFSPEKKPFIERALKTFAYGLVELLPGYVGHDVPGRKAIEARRSFAARLFGKDQVVELRLGPAELQDVCDQICAGYNSRTHGALRVSPNQKAAGATTKAISDQRALDVLLAPLAGLRVVTKKGLRAENGTFVHPELGRLVGETVECRQDPADAGRLYVFDQNGAFVCVAEDPDRTGVSRQEIASAAKAIAARQLADERARMREARRREIPDATALVRDIVNAKAASTVVAFPGRSTSHDSTGMQAAAQAARADDAPQAPARTAIDAERARRVAADAARRLTAAQADNDQAAKRARQARALAIHDALAAGHPPAEADAAWFATYRESPEFRTALHFRRSTTA